MLNGFILAGIYGGDSMSFSTMSTTRTSFCPASCGNGGSPALTLGGASGATTSRTRSLVSSSVLSVSGAFSSYMATRMGRTFMCTTSIKLTSLPRDSHPTSEREGRRFDTVAGRRSIEGARELDGLVSVSVSCCS